MSKKGKRLRADEEYKNNHSVGPFILLGFVILSVVTIIYLSVALKTKSGNGSNTAGQNSSGVSESNGVQYIDITAKGGYKPGEISAKANLKSILRVTTSATFDCSSALVIPSLNYRNNLPPTAVTEIEIPPQAPSSVLRGTCAMGMYRFNINFN